MSLADRTWGRLRRAHFVAVVERPCPARCFDSVAGVYENRRVSEQKGGDAVARTSPNGAWGRDGSQGRWLPSACGCRAVSGESGCPISSRTRRRRPTSRRWQGSCSRLRSPASCVEHGFVLRREAGIQNRMAVTLETLPRDRSGHRFGSGVRRYLDPPRFGKETGFMAGTDDVDLKRKGRRAVFGE